MTEKNWYVVYTRPRSELKVANLLARKHIINYCPLHFVENQLIDSKGFADMGTTHPINIINGNAEQEIDYFLKTASGFGGCNTAVLFEKVH